MKTYALVGGAVLVVVLAGIVTFILFRGRAEKEVMPQQEITTEDVTVTPPQLDQPQVEGEPGSPDPTETHNDGAEAVESSRFSEPLPELDESDTFLRALLEPELSNTVFTKALQVDHLVRSVVTATDLVARKKNPFRRLFFLHPGGDFLVEERSGKIFISDENYMRFHPALNTLEQFDPKRLANFYRYLEPLMVMAYQELGNADLTWRKALTQSLDQVMAAPVPRSSPELVGRTGAYIFESEDLEALAPVEKMMIRMGERNADRLKRFLTRFREAAAL